MRQMDNLTTNMPPATDKSNPAPTSSESGMNRRSFLRKSAVGLSGLAALAASLAPLRHLKDYTSAEEFVQKHYKKLLPLLPS